MREDYFSWLFPGGRCRVGVGESMPVLLSTPAISRGTMIQCRLIVSLLVVALLLLAQVGPLRAFSYHANSDAELEFRMHQRSHLDAKAGSEDQSLGGVPNWNNDAPEWDELTRCIRSSESGDTIARWLDCLESLEKLTAPDSAALSPTGFSSEIASSDADVNVSVQPVKDRMETFDPLAESSLKVRKKLNSSDGNSVGVEGLVSARVQDSTAGLADEKRTLSSGNVLREHGSSSGSEIDNDMSANSGEHSPLISSEEISSPGRGDARDGADSARSSDSKWEAGTSRSLQSSSSDGNAGCLEVPTEASSSTTGTSRLQNVLDALKLATCLGAITKLLWGRRAQLLASGRKAQSVLTGQAVEFCAPPTKQFAKAGFLPPNNDGGSSIKVGDLSSPLGLAIGTVMVEALQQEDIRRPSRTADELSKLFEAAMIEALSPVMGSECPGFVEQFKQSFSSQYRLLGSVRSASGRNFASSFANHGRDFSQRRPEVPSKECHRRTDAEEDDSSGLTKGSKLNLGINSSFKLPSRKYPDLLPELVDQFSKLTLPLHGPEAVAKSVDVKGTSSDGENSTCVDQEIVVETGDISSSVGLDDVCEGLSEKRTDDHVPQVVHPFEIRNRYGRRMLEQQAASQQVYKQECLLEPGDAGIEMQPFESASNGQLVTVSESSLAHYDGEKYYQQQKILLSQQEMELRKMELNLKYRELHLKEANLHLASENNTLMREHVDLSRNKVEFKEAEYQDRKLTAAHAIFAKRCADEMVAGLCVMLCALFFGAWKYSHERLVDIVSTCQPTLYEPSNSYVPGFNTVVNSLNHLSSRLHMFVCEVTVASRMLLGLGIISFVAAALLRKSVASNSQAMPATILIVVLGGICGFAGKLAVDSLGGSGYHWLLLWEAFCMVHTLATCFTSMLYRILNGAPASVTGKWQWQRQTYIMKPWLRRFWFHVVMVLVLPVLTGLVPFAHLREVVQLLAFNFWHLAYSPIESYLRKNHSQSSFV